MFVNSGEANMQHGESYKCQFAAMIKDWRAKFSVSSEHTTDDTFPFGFVQVRNNTQ